MICTCTLNPSLDYYMECSKPLQSGVLNRSDLEYYEAGGKGINVSIVLNNLGIPSRAFGFIGGFTRDFYIRLLAKYEFIQPNFTYTNGHTRINLKLRANNEATDVNAMGPVITDEDMCNLAKKIDRLGEGDFLVVAGNTQAYLVDDVHVMLQKAVENNVKVCLDTDPALTKDMLKGGVFLIKTTPEELSAMVNRDIVSEEDIIGAARQLVHEGAENVIVVVANKEAILACKKGIYGVTLSKPDSKAINTVGTGDSMVAGFLMDYLRSKDSVDSFRFGASCGAATAYSKSLATRELIDNFYEETKVEHRGDLD